MAKTPEAVAEFLNSERLAVAGVSRSGNQPANPIFKKLRDAVLEVYPINPRAQEVDGVECFPDVASLPVRPYGEAKTGAKLREIVCMLLAGLTVSTLLCCGNLQRPLSATDDEIWEDFEQWVEGVLESPAEERASLQDLYIGYLVESGLTAEKAQWRMERIIDLRGASTERERIYWNAKHKLGDGPAEPLTLVREAARDSPPGKALDVAMGNGRHAIYLALLGWETTGYDFSPESVRAARALAAEAGVNITAVEASHATFDFGEEAWDLIIVTYPYYDTMDSTWPPRLWKAMRPGGRVVFQGVAESDTTPEDFERLWQPFDLMRCEILDRGEDWFEGRESRTVKLIARKE